MKDKKELILLVDLDDNNVDYIFNIERKYLEQAIDFRNKNKGNPQFDGCNDIELIEYYLQREFVDYECIWKPTRLYY